MEEGREPEPLPYAVEYIEGIARRLHNVLIELQEATPALVQLMRCGKANQGVRFVIASTGGVEKTHDAKLIGGSWSVARVGGGDP